MCRTPPARSTWHSGQCTSGRCTGRCQSCPTRRPQGLAGRDSHHRRHSQNYPRSCPRSCCLQQERIALPHSAARPHATWVCHYHNWGASVIRFPFRPLTFDRVIVALDHHAVAPPDHIAREARMERPCRVTAVHALADAVKVDTVDPQPPFRVPRLQRLVDPIALVGETPR
eukprot:3070552-Prymnesium_polylepis.3